ncbi:hypothetical protein EDD22DRAFT_844651 [Suillus occidentalis]|nr:hypothetical protein EDD22DRAFT_844651 [Suillus occidentalis]
MDFKLLQCVLQAHLPTLCLISDKLTLLNSLFDFCITFDSEVRWIWGRKWGIVRIAFVISRYPSNCKFCYIRILRHWVNSRRNFIHFVGAVAAEGQNQPQVKLLSSPTLLLTVLLVTRIYVLWGGTKKFLIAISVFSMVMNAAMLAISMLDVDSTRGVFEEGQNASIIYGLLTFYELVLVSLTLYKRFKWHRLERSPLVANLYRHGVIYLLCITVASMANCIAIAVLPLSRRSPQVVVHSVLASRILFNLRALQESQDVTISRPVISSRVVFGPNQYSVLELPEIENIVK